MLARRTNVAVVAALTVLGTGLVVLLVARSLEDHFSDHTVCFAFVDSASSADELEAAANKQGFSVSADNRPGFHLTFDSPATGEDAESFRHAFKGLVDREHGRLGHPGDGCLTKPFGD
jgi:hypothetical protein